MSDIPVIRRARARAQRWLCYYCSHPMFGEGGPYDAFRDRRAGDALDVTAEHLVMRADGGGHDPENVVAAHKFCNAMRPGNATPEQHRAHVQQKVREGRWFQRHLRAAVQRATDYAARSRARGSFRPILTLSPASANRDADG